MKKIYLCCPYQHASPRVSKWRAEQADKKAAELMESGYLVFSPLSHSVTISKYCKEIGEFDHDFWLRQDMWVLEACDEIHVLQLEGWEDSHGVDVEIMRGIELGMPVIYHKPDRPTWV